MSEKLEELERRVAKISRDAARAARLHGSTGARSPSPAASISTDTTLAPPKACPGSAPDMFPGLVGDVARAATRHTDVSPVAVAAGFLSFLGAMAGRDVYFPIGDTWHHPRLFTLHIGRSGRGGKGDALQLIRRIRQAIASDRPELLGQVHSGGLSSREGLAMLIHDGFTQNREDVPAIDDKRLWVVESEFSNILAQGKRDGNTLSAALRELWDGGAIRPATKTGRVWASRPHVGLAAAITPSELHSLMNARDLSNGFANRFLMFWAERPRYEPEPQATAADVLADLAGRTADVLAFAKGNYPADQDTRVMRMSHAARELWRDTHVALRCPLESDTLTALLERRAPYAARLAMLFALRDRALVIEEWHLRSALAWVSYACASVRYVFSNQSTEAKAQAFDQMAARIGDFLRERPDGATMKELTNECFSRRATAVPLDDVLHRMLSDPRFGLDQDEQPRPDGRPGKGRKVYRLRNETLRT
ncbi:hypothetical protein EWI61_00105 [Methylolobus aquaticus]|nr:hypothetical protein EWI61_00105 [Methylolobus aquaticus]